MTEQKVIFKNSKGQKLAGILHTPEGKGPFRAVVFVHGFRGRCKDGPKPLALAEALTKKGFVFLRFDFSNIGESEGNFENTTITQYVDDLRCAIDFVLKIGFVEKDRISLVGSSLGGLVATILATKDKRVKSLVLSSPVASLDLCTGELKDLMKKCKENGYVYINLVSANKYCKLNYTFYQDYLKYNGIELAKKIDIPTLILHGDKDDIVPLEGSKEILKNLKGEKALEIIEGADHYFREPAQFEKMIKTGIDWLTKNRN